MNKLMYNYEADVEFLDNGIRFFRIKRKLESNYITSKYALIMGNMFASYFNYIWYSSH